MSAPRIAWSLIFALLVSSVLTNPNLNAITRT